MTTGDASTGKAEYYGAALQSFTLAFGESQGLIQKILADAGVEFVVVGGMAAVLHGAPLVTGDLDVVPRRDPPNVERLLGVLRDVAYIAYIAACYTPIVVVPGACTSAKKAMDKAKL